MSTNDERGWFAPKNDRWQEEDPWREEDRPPPPSSTPPPGLSVPLDEPSPAEETIPYNQIVPPISDQGRPAPSREQGMPFEQGTLPRRGRRHVQEPQQQPPGNPPGTGMTHGHGVPPTMGGVPSGPRAEGGPSFGQNPPPGQGGAPYGQSPPPGAPYGQAGPDAARARSGPPDVSRPQRPVPRHGMPTAPHQGRPRHLHSDQQVWPPAAREPVGGTTQPIPAVRLPAPAPAAAPEAPRPEDRQPPPQGPQEPAAAQPAPRPRRQRTLLVAAGAVLVSLLATGAQVYDGYLFREKTVTQDIKVTTVAAGGVGKVHNIEYKSSITPTQAPKDSKHGPEVTWLKVVISKKVLDAAQATMTAAPYDVELEDRRGRTWTVVMDRYGTLSTEDKLEVGKEYKIDGMAIVPTPVANEVELSFRPSSYRSDTPTEDLFKRETVEKMEKDNEVLRFRRR